MFQFEASCRHGLRQGFTLKGWTWREADTEASEIVLRALNQIGAKRPTWLQGQPEWADTAPSTRTVWEFTNCARCGKPLPEHNAHRFYARFCSRLCSTRTQTEKYQREHREELVVKARARRLANPEKAREAARRFIEKLPEQQCEKCGKTFKPKRYKQRFCSLECRPHGRWANQTGLKCEEMAKPVEN